MAMKHQEAYDAEPAMGQPLYGEAAEGRFVVQGYRDVWAAVLFLITAAATLGTAGYHVVKDGDSAFDFNHIDSNVTEAPKEKIDDVVPNIVLWIPVSAVVASTTGLLMLAVMQRFARQYIHFSWGVLIGCCCFLTVYLYVHKMYMGAIICSVMVLLYTLFIYLARHRIPFSSVLLEAASSIVSEYKATILVAFLSCFVAAGYQLFTAVALNPYLPDYKEVDYGDRKETHRVKDGNVGLVIVFAFFFFWAMQVIAGVVHVTSCGVAATWYFFSSTNMPANPTLKSFQRATTTSFGSICFGSLIVAVLRTIRFVLELARSEENSFLTCCIDCILSCIESLVQYFNQWAFAQVAIYGKSYIEAAKATFRMMKTGDAWEGVINDSLVDAALIVTILINGALTGVIAGLLSWSLVMGVIGLIIGFFVGQVIVAPVDSSVMTIFICFADTRDYLQQTNPELYTLILERISVNEARQQ